MRLLSVGVMAVAGFKIVPLSGQKGKVTLRVVNRRDEVVAKVDVDYGEAGKVDLAEQAEGTYWLDADGLRTEIHLVHRLTERLAKLNADLPGDRSTPELAGLDARLKLLRDAQRGRPFDTLGDLATELLSLEADVEAVVDGRELPKVGDLRRAIVIGRDLVPYRLHVPKSVKKGGALVAVVSDEAFWFECTKLVEIADAAGFIVVGGGREVIEQVKKDYGVTAVTLMGDEKALALAEEYDVARVIAFGPAAGAGLKKLKDVEVRIFCGGRDPRIEAARGYAAAAKGMKNVRVEERPESGRFTIAWDALSEALR